MPRERPQKRQKTKKRNCQPVFQSGCTIFAFLPAMNESSCCSTSFTAFEVVSGCSHSHCCAMVSHCCFSFLFLFLGLKPRHMEFPWARSPIETVADRLHHRQIQATSATYTTAHGNTRSITHCRRPGIKSSSSCILVRLVSTEP